MSTEDMLTKLIQNMDQYAQQEAPKGRLEVKPGQICLAHFSADNVWYRARVLEVDMDNVKVMYAFFYLYCLDDCRCFFFQSIR